MAQPSEQEELPVWQQRWNAFAQAVDDTIAQCQGGEPRIQTLGNLGSCLKIFAQAQFDFFDDGFGKQTKYILETSPECPPDFVFRVFFQQALYDLEAIQQALHQRLVSSGGAREVLDKADKLAWNALKLAQGGLLPEEARVITYFQKSPNIRIVPYTPVALIGIPLTCLQTARDYLAIPHEVGHYVYQHGRKGERLPVLLHNLKDSLPSWCYDWREEIFADIYGCLTAGPLIAQDFQDLAREEAIVRFTAHDGEHPSPILRPFIYTQVLHKKGHIDWAIKLRDEWLSYSDQRLDQYNYSQSEEAQHAKGTFYSDGSPPIEIESVMSLTHALDIQDRPIDKVIDEILSWLQDSPMTSWPDSLPSLEGDLYKHFETELESFLANQEKPLELTTGCSEGDTTDIWEQWVKEEKFFPQQQLDLPGLMPPENILIKAGTLNDLKDRPSYDNWNWLRVLFGNGWITKAPTGVWP